MACPLAETGLSTFTCSVSLRLQELSATDRPNIPRQSGGVKCQAWSGCAENFARFGACTLTYQSRIPEAFYYPNSTWRQWLGGYQFQKQPGVAYLDAAAFFYFYATGVTPAMEAKMVGQGSQYAVGLLDSQGNPLDGGKTYRLHVLPNAPVKDFWSAIVYDNQTRSMLQTDQDFPQVSSLDKGLVVNADGSVDVYFGPQAPSGIDHPRQGLEHAVPAVRPA